MSFARFLLATVVGMAPATFVYSFLGERAPQYIEVMLVAFGVVIGAAVVYALVTRYRKGRKPRVK
jgi:uncharacterized membrane protein YdjX (TVP38/TMEM64 family)